MRWISLLERGFFPFLPHTSILSYALILLTFPFFFFRFSLFSLDILPIPSSFARGRDCFTRIMDKWRVMKRLLIQFVQCVCVWGRELVGLRWLRFFFFFFFFFSIFFFPFVGCVYDLSVVFFQFLPSKSRCVNKSGINAKQPITPTSPPLSTPVQLKKQSVM